MHVTRKSVKPQYSRRCPRKQHEWLALKTVAQQLDEKTPARTSPNPSIHPAQPKPHPSVKYTLRAGRTCGEAGTPSSGQQQQIRDGAASCHHSVMLLLPTRQSLLDPQTRHIKHTKHTRVTAQRTARTRQPVRQPFDGEHTQCTQHSATMIHMLRRGALCAA